MNVEKKLTLVEHLEELRSRIIKSLIFIAIMMCFLYSFSGLLLDSLVKPVGKLVFIAPQEAFVVRLKIAFLGSLVLSSPLIIYQLWKFLFIGLKPKEKKYSLLFGSLSFILFILGAGFGYFLIIPIGLKFLLRCATKFVTPMIAVDGYLSFVATLVLAFGIVFQLPFNNLFSYQNRNSWS